MLPHLSGVPHLHVNRSLQASARRLEQPGPARFKFLLREPKKHLLKAHTESKRGIQHIFGILIHILP